MSKTIQSTEAGFILEGEVCPSAMVTHAETDALELSLRTALTRFGGQRVRITVEVLRTAPTDRLRDLIERFREETEEQPSRRQAGA